MYGIISAVYLTSILFTFTFERKQLAISFRPNNTFQVLVSLDSFIIQVSKISIKLMNEQSEQKPKSTNAAVFYQSSFIVYHTAINALTTLKQAGTKSARETLQVAKQYMEKYPSLGMFVYSTALLSAIPVGIFSLCFATSLLISIGTAAAGVVMVQSTMFLIGLTVLVPIEIGIVAVAGGATLLLQSVGSPNLIEFPQKVVSKYESFLVEEPIGEDTLIMN
jgi:hypothetical protein